MILITRPEPSATHTATELQALEFDVVCDPLLNIATQPWQAPDWEKITAIIITSKNALRGFEGHAMPKHKPYYVVGEVTSDTLRKMGFIHVTGTVERSDDLVPLITMQHKAEGGSFVHLTAPHNHDGFVDKLRAVGLLVEQICVYEAIAASEFQSATQAVIKAGKITAATFYSVRSAEIFAQCLMGAGLTEKCKSMLAVCLSQAVADSCKTLPWQRILVAQRPTQKHMLECLAPARE